MQSHANIGHIPQGTYTVGAPRPGGHMGPNAIPLVPDFATAIAITMMGRDPNSFYMHGNNATNDASSGCIIMPPNRTNILPGEVINVVQ